MSDSNDTFHQPSPEYAADIKQLDAQPWDEHSAVDSLIVLQRDAFLSEVARDHARHGAIALQMADIERSLNNSSEAAAYTQEAVDAFDEGDMAEDAIAASCVLATEYRNLQGPDLAVAAMQRALALRTGDAQTETVLDIQISPLFTQLGRLLEPYTNGTMLRKGPRPSRDAMESLFGQTDALLDVPLAVSRQQLSQTTSTLSTTYHVMSRRELGMSSSERKLAKERSVTLGTYSFALVFAHMHASDFEREHIGPAVSLRDAVSASLKQVEKSYRRVHGRKKTLTF